MANQPITCVNILCPLWQRGQWNKGYIETEENAPWDDYPCPICGKRTAPLWSIKYKLPGQEELEQNILTILNKMVEVKDGFISTED